MTDLALFDMPEESYVLNPRIVPPPRARKTDPDTSHAAARSIGRGAEQAIMAAFAAHDGWTSDELCRRLNRLHSPTVVSALARLHKGGVLRDSGARRLSSRGRLQCVWVRHEGDATV